MAPRAAFTLIEVLLAVLIVSAGFTVVLASLGMSVSALEAARDSMRAGVLLAELREDIGHNGLPRSSSGEFRGENADFSWTIDVTPAPWADAPGLGEARITLHNGRSGRSYSSAACVRLD